jgi:Tfp pilus assembly protein PilZ
LEKRKTPRKIKRLAVTWTDGTVEYTGVTSNVSATGIFIRTRKPFHEGTSLKILLEIGKSQTIALTGVVVRSIKTGLSDFKNGMGIQLTEIPQEYSDFIKGFD